MCVCWFFLFFSPKNGGMSRVDTDDFGLCHLPVASLTAETRLLLVPLAVSFLYTARIPATAAGLDTHTYNREMEKEKKK